MIDTPRPWPPIGFEQVAWTAEPDASQSRRQRLRARGPYQATTVPNIADSTPHLSARTQALAEEAIIEMVRFDRDLGESSAPFPALLLRSESAASSQIENLTASAKRIALAQLGDYSSPNATLIASNVAAMQAATDLADELKVQNILKMHQALLGTSQPQIAGKLRTTPVWIGGNSPHTAQFVPPRHELIDAALDDLVGFMQRDDLPVLTQVAIAHAQFETIHPFSDGNGRTGRALMSALLRNKGITQNVTIPVSSGLLANTSEYFDALGSYQQGDPEPMTELLAESTFTATDNGRELAREIQGAQAQIYAGLGGKASPSMQSSIEMIAREPAISAEFLIETTGQSTSSAYRNIAALEEIGALKRSNTVRGRKIWFAPAIIQALDEFALRAGKRKRERNRAQEK